MASAAMVVTPIYRVISPLNYEPIALSDVNRYKAWYGSMRDKIQALHSNDTWSLVLFHHSMNVIGSRWVYKIKRHSDDSIERYRA